MPIGNPPYKCVIGKNGYSDKRIYNLICHTSGISTTPIDLPSIASMRQVDTVVVSPAVDDDAYSL